MASASNETTKSKQSHSLSSFEIRLTCVYTSPSRYEQYRHVVGDEQDPSIGNCGLASDIFDQVVSMPFCEKSKGGTDTWADAAQENLEVDSTATLSLGETDPSSRRNRFQSAHLGK